MTIKEKLYKILQERIDEKIRILKESISFAKESRDADTKSSAGDKYETGREMIQAEINKSEQGLGNLIAQKTELSKLNLKKQYSKVELGSIIITDKGNYFIATAFGKIRIEDKDYYSISAASPIAKCFWNKKIGDKLKFQNREYSIIKIV